MRSNKWCKSIGRVQAYDVLNYSMRLSIQLLRFYSVLKYSVYRTRHVQVYDVLKYSVRSSVLNY